MKPTMNTKDFYCIGLDVHKKMIAFCIKTADGTKVRQGEVAANREALTFWLTTLPQPWKGTMEATLFTGWIYEFLKPHAYELLVAHPEMVKAITAAKKKNDRADAEKLADLLRTNLLPVCHMPSPEIRELRRVLRYRSLIVRTSVRFRNKICGLLMETGVAYDPRKIAGKKYFSSLIDRIEDVPDSVVDLLKTSKGGTDLFRDIQKRLTTALHRHDLLRERVERLMTIPGVGEVTALTWALEIGDVSRFDSIRKAISYCGLCSAQKESAGKQIKGPISKKRNKHLQTVLIEAAKLAPRWNPELHEIHEKELKKGNKNRATLAVARRLVGYLMAIDRRETGFVSTMQEAV